MGLRPQSELAAGLVVILLAASGCRCGGRRASDDRQLADIGEAAPELVARLRAAGGLADVLIDARTADIDRIARAAARPARSRPGPTDERPGDRLAADLANATQLEVAVIRGGVVRGLSSYQAFGW